MKILLDPRAVTKVAMPAQPLTDGSSSNAPARRAGAMRPPLLAVDLAVAPIGVGPHFAGEPLRSVRSETRRARLAVMVGLARTSSRISLRDAIRGSTYRQVSRAGSRKSNRYARLEPKHPLRPGVRSKGWPGVCSWKRIAAPRRWTVCTTSTTCRETRKGLTVRSCCVLQHSSMNRTSRAASGRSRKGTCAGTPSRPPTSSPPRWCETSAG